MSRSLGLSILMLGLAASSFAQPAETKASRAIR